MAGGAPLLPRPVTVPTGHTAQRVTDNVRRTAPAQIIVPAPIPFVFPGALTTDVSPAFALPFGYVLDGIDGVCLGTAGSTDTVLTVYLDAVSQFTLTLTASSTAIFNKLAQDVGTFNQKLTIAATTVGTGAKDLGGYFRWMQLA